MLLDRDNWPRHRPWFWVFVLGTLGALGWYLYEAFATSRWPGGSSLPGFVFGIVGGAICLFEFLLWVRKKYFRVWRLGRTQAWMRAHIWLGLLAAPVLFLHGGMHFGGDLSTALMVLLLIVIASGIWGLVLQNLLPKKMLDDVPAETIYSQIDRLSAQLEGEAYSLVAAVCGLETRKREAEDDGAGKEAYVVVGAVRQVGMVQGKSVATRPPLTVIPGCEPLERFFKTTVAPFLLRGAQGQERLAHPNRAKVDFDNLRIQLPPEAHPVVNTLEAYCEQRRQWERQARIHFWLHNWLWVHFPLSVALIVLMFVHVFVALKYY